MLHILIYDLGVRVVPLHSNNFVCNDLYYAHATVTKAAFKLLAQTLFSQSMISFILRFFRFCILFYWRSNNWLKRKKLRYIYIYIKELKIAFVVKFFYQECQLLRFLKENYSRILGLHALLAAHIFRTSVHRFSPFFKQSKRFDRHIHWPRYC